MLLLAVDTSSRLGSLAVLRDGQLVGVISTFADEPYSTRLFRQLDFLLTELHLEVRQFDVFAVVAGPGSFTGLRVGLAAVKGWAEVFEKPVVAVSGLEVVAAQAKSGAQLIAPAMDARRGQIYAALYRREGSGLVCESEDHVCTVDEFFSELGTQAGNRSVQFVSPAPEIIQGALAAATRDLGAAVSWNVERASPLLAPVVAELAFDRANRGEVTDALRLDANYIRRTDAELLWKAP
ncbi:MAG TPA: tRNA (adenosine(37)-N6)-threonylcarbamoyltransferase complex dimerization subunit type 1 TsaB [Candidatus Acidoferrales bacterium]|nr:tRNA (adenosine(37)-N6)-threonylcarbamoyltransferase complex dimerization subunit type 1 TsaB [Candidatus Acidoferrales bacterium]